jgi:hypothetical protein
MAMSVEKLVEHFSSLEDPRCAGKVDHRLIDILVIAVCAVIACAESWDDIALYGRNKVGWLRSFLTLANGIPSHDTWAGATRSPNPNRFRRRKSAAVPRRRPDLRSPASGTVGDRDTTVVSGAGR